jgi:hypothetical protein
VPKSIRSTRPPDRASGTPTAALIFLDLTTPDGVTWLRKFVEAFVLLDWK